MATFDFTLNFLLTTYLKLRENKLNIELCKLNIFAFLCPAHHIVDLKKEMSKDFFQFRYLIGIRPKLVHVEFKKVKNKAICSNNSVKQPPDCLQVNHLSVM